MHRCSLSIELVGPVPRRNQGCRQNQTDTFVSCCTKWRCLLTSSEMWEHLHHLVHHGTYIQGFGGEIWGKETSWKNRRRWEVKIKMDYSINRMGGWWNWKGMILPRREKVVGSFEGGNKPSGSIKYGKFLDWLNK